MESTTTELALALKASLQRTGQRLVLAESCTAGRVAATLAMLPGISQWLCGSFVIYRNDSKARWLGIAPELLSDPEIGPVSDRVSRELATAILQRTPEAGIGLAITGDIGPGAAAETDGKVFCAVRSKDGNVTQERTWQLSCPPPANNDDLPGRLARLEEATQVALHFANQFLQNFPSL